MRRMGGRCRRGYLWVVDDQTAKLPCPTSSNERYICPHAACQRSSRISFRIKGVKLPQDTNMSQRMCVLYGIIKQAAGFVHED